MKKNFIKNLIKNAELFGEYGMPKGKPCFLLPKELTPFNFLKSKGAKDFVHFFIDDIQFERVWKQPNVYLKILKKTNGILGTDFSIYLDMSKPEQIYSIFKNRCLDYYFSTHGINVIPTVSWSDSTSFKWCFDGLPKNSVVAISTNGCQNPISKYYFEAGYNTMIEKLNPTYIICYGRKFKFMKEKNIIEFPNYIEKLRKLK